MDMNMNEDLSRRTIQRTKEVILSEGLERGHVDVEELEKDLDQLDSFVGKYEHEDTVRFVDAMCTLVLKHRLVTETLMKVLSSVPKTIKREMNIEIGLKGLENLTKISNVPERFHEQVKYDYKRLIEKYHDEMGSDGTILYSRVFEDLIELFGVYHRQYTMNEFRSSFITVTLLSFPERFHEDITNRMNEVIDSYLTSFKDPRCKEIDQDFLNIFIETYELLTDEEKAGMQSAPLYARPFIHVMREETHAPFLAYNTSSS